MSRQHISLRSRVRYEGRVKTFDRRGKMAEEDAKIPNPIWRRVGQVLRLTFRTSAENRKVNSGG